MRRFLLDTDVLSFCLREQAQVVQRVARYLQGQARLELSVKSYYELRKVWCGSGRINACSRWKR